MARHIAAHRWAAAAAGRLSSAKLRSMQAHAQSCDRCSRARDRVRDVREGFAEIREGEPPRLDWEHIGARIYWVTSSERRAASRSELPSHRRRLWLYGGLAAAGAAAAVLVAITLGADDGPSDANRATAAIPALAAEPAKGGSQPLEVELLRAPAEALEGIVTYLEGEVLAGGAALEFDRTLGPGDVLTTGAKGRVTVQFGHASGFTLAPKSTLEVRALDTSEISLVLTGDVTVDIERRPYGQSFEVVAGDHVVAVRGTAFRVGYRQGALAVACARGKVALRARQSPGTELDVSAGQLFELPAGQSMRARSPVDLSAEAAAVLERDVGVRLLPVWNGADALHQTSATLRLDARGSRPVTVDGERIGRGGVQFRVMPGRHLVDTGAGPSWIRTPGGAVVDGEAVASPKQASKARKQRAGQRRAHLDRALSNGARARRCMRSLEKQGLLEGSFVEFDIGVNADGSLGYLNLRRSNVSSRAAACVRSIVDSVRLPTGPKATLRYRIGF